MKYVIKNSQDMDDLLEERCGKGQEFDGGWEWEGVRFPGCDVIIFNASDKWFDKSIVSKLCIWEGSIEKCRPVTKIKTEDVPKVKNTLLYIQENFDHIYQAMLERLLPSLIKWKMQNRKTQEPVTTIQQLHNAREIYEIAGMEAGCITKLQLNCQYQKDDMVFYSFIFRPDGYGDGFEVVLWKDHVVCFGDGNPEELIFYFDKYRDMSVAYFGI